MQKSSIRKISILGLVLMGASAVTAAILPRNDSPKIFDGVLQDSTSSGGGQKSCVDIEGTDDCTLTASNTSAAGTNKTSANRNSSAGKHSSKSNV